MFHWLQYAVAALALLGVAYYLLCLWSAASFLLARRRSRAVNRKVSNLLQMLPQAQHRCLLVNDGDIRVRPDYLRRVMAPFAGDRVGMVTCLYHGIAASTLGSKLEALGISTDFSAGVLTARQV